MSSSQPIHYDRLRLIIDTIDVSDYPSEFPKMPWTVNDAEKQFTPTNVRSRG
jgi:hypothetical protein